MDWLIRIMIYLGSALMVVNIVRFVLYARKLRRIERVRMSGWLLYVPLGLLIGFLVGYLIVGVLGNPDLIMSGILFGGSVYVFLFLLVTYRITDRIIESDETLRVRYEEMRNEMDSLTKTALSVLRVNLTKDLVESVEGTDLYDTDRGETAFSRLVTNRLDFILVREGGNRLTNEGLIRDFRSGHSVRYEDFLTRRQDGRICFVRLKVSMAEQPATGDVIAFITERLYDDAMVNRRILNGALAEQYDLIAYVSNGDYRVVTASEERKDGIVPSEHDGSYTSFLNDTFLPALRKDGDEDRILEQMELESVCRELNEHGTYEINAVTETGGNVRYKRFSFYPVSAEAQFFLVLVSDTTAVHKERSEQNLRLEKALDEAQKANEAKARFFSTMSHDLRTPMNAIIGFTALAEKCDDPDTLREYVGKIGTAGHQMLDIIENIMDMSRIERGKTQLVFKRTDLVAQFGELRDMFAGLMEERHLAFTADASALRDKTVSCDVKLLNRVLTNLLSNACKYTREGYVRMTAAQGAKENGYADYEFRVEDTGIGMSPAFSEMVFTPFERDDTVAEIQGTGLGMAITKSMVDLMGGTIRVESELGRGSTFILNLRLEVLKPEPAAGPAPREAEPAAGRSRRILVVDDNEINREIARLTLESSGFLVEEAENGREALDKVSGAPDGYYDLMLTDIQMPVMNGYEASRAVRALDGEKGRMPIVAITASAYEGDIHEEAKAYIDGVVLKPFAPDKLIAEILRLLPDDPSAGTN